MTATCSAFKNSVQKVSLSIPEDRMQGEHVEGSLGLKALQADGPEAVQQEAAAAVILLPHGGNVVVAILHGLDGGILAHGGRGHDAVLVQLHNLGHQLPGRAEVTQPPAGHGIGLGEAVDHDGALIHAGDSGDGDMVLVAQVSSA